MLQDHIFLVGMAGCGKTSLGQRLASSMGMTFVDTDQRISDIMSIEPPLSRSVISPVKSI